MNDLNQQKIKFNFVLSKKEFTKGLFLRSRKTFIVIGFLFLFFQAVPDAMDEYYIDAPSWPLTLLKSIVLSTSIYAALIYILRWFIGNQHYKKHKTCGKAITYEFSDEVIEIAHEIGHSSLKWDAFDKYAWTKDICVLFIGSARHIIPLRALNDDDKVKFKQLLSKNLKEI